MSKNTKNLSKTLAALTLIVAGSGSAAMAQDITPTAEKLSRATAIEFGKFDLDKDADVLAAVGHIDIDDGDTHIHVHQNARMALLGIVGRPFQV